MDPSFGVDFVLLLAFGYSSASFFKMYAETKSLMDFYFALAAFSLFLSYGFHAFNVQFQIAYFEWAKLIAVVTYISGLLALIRNLKPNFARYPLYLTVLPYLSLLFFPIVKDSFILKDLLNGIYQGGALVVTGLIFSFNFANSGRRYYLIGIGGACIAYLAYWIYFNRLNSDYAWISEMLLAIAIVITVMKFISTQKDQRKLKQVL